MWIPIVIGIGVMTGCNNDTKEPESVTVSNVKTLSTHKNIYTSESISNDNILFGGEHGLSIKTTTESSNS